MRTNLTADCDFGSRKCFYVSLTSSWQTVEWCRYIRVFYNRSFSSMMHVIRGNVKRYSEWSTLFNSLTRARRYFRFYFALLPPWSHFYDQDSPATWDYESQKLGARDIFPSYIQSLLSAKRFYIRTQNRLQLRYYSRV